MCKNLRNCAKTWEIVQKLEKLCKNLKIVLKLNKVCQKLGKSEKVCQNMRKSAKSWESMIKCAKKLRKCAKRWESMRKCAKAWESWESKLKHEKVHQKLRKCNKRNCAKLKKFLACSTNFFDTQYKFFWHALQSFCKFLLVFCQLLKRSTKVGFANFWSTVQQSIAVFYGGGGVSV